MEHMVPQSRGGSNQQDNLVPSCARCNHKKGTDTVDEFRHNLARPCSHLADILDRMAYFLDDDSAAIIFEAIGVLCELAAGDRCIVFAMEQHDGQG